MKKDFFRALVALFAVSSINPVHSQTPKYWQAGIFSGVSFPTGAYKKPIGRVSMGYTAGTFADYYFIPGKFGFGLDARFIHHRMVRNDALEFQGGILENQYVSPPRFRHIGLTIGPAYEFRRGAIGLELFAKGGVMLQQFPSYTRLLTRFDVPQGSKARIETRYQTKSDPNTNAWAVLSGFRFNYRHKSKISFFAQGDYMATAGKTFFGKPSQFTLRQAPQSGNKYPYENIGTGKTNISMINIAIGVRFLLGDDRNPNILKEIH